LPGEGEFFCHVSWMQEVGVILPRNDCERVKKAFHYSMRFP